MLNICTGIYVYQIMTGCITGRLLFLGNDANAPKLGEVKGVGYF